MKKISTYTVGWILSICLLIANTTFAQSVSNNYWFSQTLGTYTPITGGTQILAAGTDDGVSSLTNIGFNFIYHGTTFTQFSAESNGFITLGAATTGSGAVANAIGFFTRDGKTGGAVTYLLEGSAPNRVLTVQYPQYQPTYSSSTPNIDIQVKLYEGTNQIQIVYGTYTSGSSYTGLVGLTGATTSDYNRRSTSTNWTATTAATSTSASCTLSSSVTPPSGLTYTWGPITTPAISSFTPTSACPNAGSTVTITGSGFMGTSSVQFGGTNAASFTVTSDSVITAVLGTGTTGTISVTNIAGTATSISSFTVSPTPDTPSAIVSPSTIQPGGTATITASGSETTFNWYTAASGGTPFYVGSVYSSVSLCQGGVLYVAQSNGSCEGLRTAVTITVDTPNLTATRTPSNGLICSAGGSVALDVTNVNGVVYTWDGAGLNTTSGTSVVASPTQTTAYTLTGSVAGCDYHSTVNVGVLPASNASPSVTPASLCFPTENTITINSNLSAGNFGVSSIPYSYITPPAIGVTNLVVNGVAQVATQNGGLDDDGWANIPLGFSYNFFGTNFTGINVGTNGTMQFGAYNGNNQYTSPYGLGMYGGFSVFPSTNNPANMIAWLANDMHAGNTYSLSDTIRYWTEGIAPTRKFVIQFIKESQYGSSAKTNNGQVVLFETTGEVEIHLWNCLSTNTKYVGLQNSGTIGATAPGRNAFTSTITTPEAWRFSPPANYTFNWTTANSNISPVSNDSSSFTATVSAVGNYTYNVNVTNPTTGCVIPASVNFVVNQSPVAPTANNVTVNPGPATLNASGTESTFNWYLDSVGGSPLHIGASYTTDPLCTGSYTYYVEQVNSSNCPGPRKAVRVTVNQIAVTHTTSDTVCGTNSATLAATGNGSSITWYTAQTGGNPIGVGSPFTTPVVSTDTNFYASAALVQYVHAGATYSGNNNNGTSTGNHGIYITTHVPNVTIDSAYIPFTGTGTFTITVYDAYTNTQISTVTTPSVTGGGTTAIAVPLGLTIPNQGDYYVLVNAISGSIGTLGYVTGNFPYTSSVLDVTDGYWYGASSSNMYLFNLAAHGITCEGSRVAVPVHVTTPPAITVSNDTAICSGETVTLRASSSNPAYTYTWNNVSGATSVVSPTVTTTYNVLASAPNGCANSASVVVSVTQTPAAISNIKADTICVGGTANGFSVVLTNTVSGTTTGAPTFNRPNADGSAGGSSNNRYTVQSFYVNVSGSYRFDQCASWDSWGALYQNSFNASDPTVNFLIGDDASSNLSCGDNPGFDVTLTAGVQYFLVSTAYSSSSGSFTWTIVPPTGGGLLSAAPDSIVWYASLSSTTPLATGISYNPVGAVGSGLANTNTAGVYTYYVAVKNGMCQSARVPAKLYIEGTPPVASNVTTCYNHGAVLTAQGSGVISWYDAATSGNRIGTGSPFTTAPLTAPATYYVQDSSTHGCGASTRVAVNVSILQPSAASQNATVCLGDTFFVGSHGHTTGGTFVDTISNTVGCDSVVTTNLTLLYPTSSSQTLALCDGEVAVVGNITHNSEGTFVDTIPGVNTCDSVVTTTITYTHTNTYVGVSTNTAYSVETGASAFQWIKCDGSLVDGATGQAFSATTGGDYRVIIYKNNCADTSACVNLSTTGINDIDWTKAVSIYPNPTNGVATISISNFKAGNLAITISDMQGKVVYTGERTIGSYNFDTTIDLSSAAKGVYTVKLNTGKDIAVRQLLLQ